MRLYNINKFVILLIYMWSILYDERLEKWLDEIPDDIKAKIVRILDMLVTYGPNNIREPYVKPIT